MKKLTFILILFSVTLLVTNCKTSTKENQQTKQEEVTKPDIDLHAAALTGNIDAIKAHIEVKSDLNAKDAQGGSTALIISSLFGHPEIAKLLIEAGADINATNNDGSTALITAAFFCNTEIVKLLLDNEADKTIVNNSGGTALNSVQAPFEEVKGIYDFMVQAFSPLGLKLDYEHLEKTRPIIAEMLK